MNKNTTENEHEQKAARIRELYALLRSAPNRNMRTLMIGELYNLQKKRVGNPALYENRTDAKNPTNPNYATVAQLESKGLTGSAANRTRDKILKDFARN